MYHFAVQVESLGQVGHVAGWLFLAVVMVVGILTTEDET